MAPQRDEIFKQNVNDCVQHIILQKFTNFHAIRSWNFRIFGMRWWPRFYCATLYIGYHGCVYHSWGQRGHYETWGPLPSFHSVSFLAVYNILYSLLVHIYLLYNHRGTLGSQRRRVHAPIWGQCANFILYPCTAIRQVFVGEISSLFSVWQYRPATGKLISTLAFNAIRGSPGGSNISSTASARLLMLSTRTQWGHTL